LEYLDKITALITHWQTLSQKVVITDSKGHVTHVVDVSNFDFKEFYFFLIHVSTCDLFI
jgi:hypothetical protein